MKGMNNMFNPFKPETPGNVVYYRPPTKGEISFGYGATHYREFERWECTKPNGKLKHWFRANDDGLRYYLPR